ncbi:MAG: hypothetical protein NC308_07480 [Clostridium sp.]|nr:hypothetical protein [Bacteroides sp.]MCM1198714.1 hypothetical protein [Clostridium sp.]
MKRFLIMVAAAIIPVVMSAQAQITTKKMKLEDFPEKTTKIVLSGNAFLDGELEDAVKNNWHLSPYEFCTAEEFEKLKGSEDYYFLMTVKGQFRKEAEPGIEMLSLVKGGKGADKSLNKMLEVVTVPLRSSEYPSGREIVFMPALIDIIQTHVVASMDKDLNAYGGLGNYCLNITEAKGMDIVFSEDDIAESVNEDTMANIFKDRARTADEDDVDALMEQRADNTVVSYVVAPSDPQPGSFCYKMLICTKTHKLYYFRKHKITESTGTGFLTEDLRRICAR